MAIGTHHTELLADEAVERVGCRLIAADGAGSRQTRVAAGRLAAMVTDPSATAFAMRFVDRVIRPEDPAVAAGQLASLVEEAELPALLSAVDRWLLRRGARLGRRLPRIVVPLARRRMRALVGHLVVDAEPERLAAHLRSKATEGFSLNVNMLGEAVLGDAEARRRHREVLGMLAQPDVDYVSVKVSSVVSQLNPWDFDGSLDRVVEALRPLLRAAASTAPPTFINLDMEEYHDLELTTRAFCTLLDEREFADAEAGIALQAYLPDEEWHEAARASDEAAWKTEFGIEHDPAGLFCESNVLRCRPVKGVALRAEADAAPRDVARARAAAARCGVPLTESHATDETSAEFVARLGPLGVERVRVTGTCSDDLRAAANEAGVHIADDPVTAEGRIELLHHYEWDTPDGFIAHVSKSLGGAAVSVHQGHMPEIELIDAASARGIWAMFDYVDIPGKPPRQGYGHYHETYRKESDGWRIASLELTRLRVDALDARPERLY